MAIEDHGIRGKVQNTSTQHVYLDNMLNKIHILI